MILDEKREGKRCICYAKPSHDFHNNINITSRESDNKDHSKLKVTCSSLDLYAYKVPGKEYYAISMGRAL